jgi:hypothetical protein
LDTMRSLIPRCAAKSRTKRGITHCYSPKPLRLYEPRQTLAVARVAPLASGEPRSGYRV